MGAILGEAIKDLVTIVTPRTFLKWINASKPRPRAEATTTPSQRNPGRPKTPDVA